MSMMSQTQVCTHIFPIKVDGLLELCRKQRSLLGAVHKLRHAVEGCF